MVLCAHTHTVPYQSSAGGQDIRLTVDAHGCQHEPPRPLHQLLELGNTLMTQSMCVKGHLDAMEAKTPPCCVQQCSPAAMRAMHAASFLPGSLQHTSMLQAYRRKEAGVQWLQTWAVLLQCEPCIPLVFFQEACSIHQCYKPTEEKKQTSSGCRPGKHCSI